MKKIFIILLLFTFPLMMAGQNIPVYRSASGTGNPELTWFSLLRGLRPNFTVYRAPVGTEDFRLVSTFHRFSERNDTLFFSVTDTTLEKKGLYTYFIEITDSKETVLRSDIIYGHNMGSIPSPTVVDFTATSDTVRKAITLNWKLNYGFTVKTQTLFRSRNYDKGFERVATLPAETNRYTDPVQVSNEPYFYFLLISDYFGYQLPSVVVHGICTFAEKPYPPQDFSAEVTGETVRLSWRGLGNNIIGYRVFRSDGENSMFIQMTPLLPPDSLAAFTDTSTTRPGMVSVRYYAVAVSDGYLDSNPTDTLSVMLPWNMIVDAPAELDQVPDSTGHVKLFWTLPETPGVVGYNIYRSYGGSEARKINETLIPFEKNSFTDSSPIGYGAYDYFVESIGSAGRPSASRTAVHADRPVPSYHVVLNAVSAEKLIVLSWAVPDFPGLDVFYVYRQEGSGTARMVSMVKPSAGTWTDGDTRTGTTYIYTLVAEFKGGDRLLVNNGVLVAAE